MDIKWRTWIWKWIKRKRSMETVNIFQNCKEQGANLRDYCITKQLPTWDEIKNGNDNEMD